LASKIAAVSIAGLLIVYAVYAIVGCYILLADQPRFVFPDGTTTVSHGLVIESYIFIGILVFAIIIEALFVFFLFFFKRVRLAHHKRSERSK